jgi:DHA1 family bicyclomycin/chloramphenicol resistance-like MFS transporter
MSVRNVRSSMQRAADPTVKLAGARVVTAVLAAVAAIGQVSTTIYLPSIPALSQSLGTSESLVQLTIVAYLVPFAVFQLLAGPIADSRGRRPTLAAGMMLFIAGSLLGALSWHISVLFVGRFLQGVGASAGYTVSRAVARDLFEGTRLTRVIGDIAMAFALAPGFMPLLGGFANDVLGWRANFGIAGAFGLVILASVLVFLPETLRARVPLDVTRLLNVAYAPIARSARFLSLALLSAIPLFGLFAFFTAGPAYTMNTLGLTPMQFGVLPPLAVTGFLAGLTLSRRLQRGRYAGRIIGLGIGLGLLAAGLIYTLQGLGALGAVAFTVCMFLHATGMGMVIPEASAEAIRPYGASAGAASALLGFIQMAGAIAGTLLTSYLGALLGRYAFPEVMLLGAVAGCVAWVLTRHSVRSAGRVVVRASGEDAAGVAPSSTDA